MAEVRSARTDLLTVAALSAVAFVVSTFCHEAAGHGSACLAVGILNPLGLYVLLASAIASSFGGASGLLWCARLARDDEAVTLSVGRNWLWIVGGVALVAAYALVLGPTIHFGGSD